MRVYIAGATPAQQYIRSYKSFLNLEREPGDELFEPKDFTRGDVTRTRFGEEFLARREFDAILLLDLDMIHPPDLLRRLRAHDLDMVTGHYFKRGTSPMMSVCSVGEEWPYEPLFDVPRSGLHEIANAGFGCILIKREVVEAVAKTLYAREPVFSLGPMPEMTGDHGPMGSDFRFLRRARDLGYKLWLDASAESAHAVTSWLTHELYDILRPHQMKEWSEYWAKHIGAYGEMHGMDKQAAEIRLKQLEVALRQAREQAKQWADKARVIEGQMAEREFDTKIDAQKPSKLPVLSKEEVARLVAKRHEVPGGHDPKDVKEAREEVYRREAQEFVDELQSP